MGWACFTESRIESSDARKGESLKGSMRKRSNNRKSCKDKAKEQSLMRKRRENWVILKNKLKVNNMVITKSMENGQME